ncbi:hypothetical protein QFZ56_002802 [Streptomyces achromogenes]|uniref:Uncharacterized protein n=1 Tax=Streptomyces achromogenes TaxID=67255 RepID=A0ABU0PZL9_STRAH|nr:hypothetical protein [Streptomyces achromogenes]MDQ0683839.1 hypothetical protein [Streptomyces achromogenes]
MIRRAYGACDSPAGRGSSRGDRLHSPAQFTYLDAPVPFGRPVRIPAPFDFELDPSGFGVPAEQSAEDEQR